MTNIKPMIIKWVAVKDSAQLFRCILFFATAIWLIIRGNIFSPTYCPWRFCVTLFLVASFFGGVKVMKINPVRMVCYIIVGGLLLLY